MVSTSLSNNFFEGLLIKEMELNNEFTMEKLLGLVAQYSLAIEFYLQIDSMKAKAFQNRLEYLLTNKDTLIQLSKHKSGKVDDNEKKEPVKNKKDFNQTKTYVKLKQEDIKSEDISKKVNTVLNNDNSKEEIKKTVQILISDDIQKQNVKWKEKIKTKKKKNLRSTFKENIGMNALKKKVGDKSLQLRKDNLLAKSVEIKGSDALKINTNNNGDIFDNLEEKDEMKINNNEEIKEDKKEEEKKEEIKIEVENENKDKIEEEKKKEDNKTEEEENENKSKENENENEEKKKEESKNEENKIVEKQKENENKIIVDNKEEEDNSIIENENENSKDIENTIYDLMLKQEEENKEEENAYINPTMNRASIVDEDMIRKLKPDEEITKPINDQIKTLKEIIDNLNIKKTLNENDYNNEDDEDSQNEESNKNSENSNSNNNLNKISNDKNEKNLENNLIDSTANKVPAKFLSTYYQVESLLIEYMNNFNEFFYHDIFEQFSSGLKELYELKYKKYIEIRNEYHNQIKEKEYLLENDENLNEEKKNEIQQTIDSLNEEQQHQIDSVEDEFNRKIVDKISEFKLNSFKSNSGIQLLEEQVKLNIYSLINESFY